jgi:hypothetical protein
LQITPDADPPCCNSKIAFKEEISHCFHLFEKRYSMLLGINLILSNWLWILRRFHEAIYPLFNKILIERFSKNILSDSNTRCCHPDSSILSSAEVS